MLGVSRGSRSGRWDAARRGKTLSLPSTPPPRVIVSRPQPQAAVSEIPPIGPGEIWCGRADVPRPGDVGRQVVFEMLVDRLHALRDSQEAGFRIGLHELVGERCVIPVAGLLEPVE